MKSPTSCPGASYCPPPSSNASDSQCRCSAMPASGPSPYSRVILRRDPAHDRRVGVALVARVLAHAVGDHAPRLARGRDHGAARAHAEAVDRAPVAAVVHQLVVGRAEQRMPRLRPEARLVDQRLRVLDAEADREGLGFDEHAARVQHRERVARAVAQRHHHVVGAQFARRSPASRRARGGCRRHRSRPARRRRGWRNGSRRRAPRSSRASPRPCRPAGTCRCAAC